MTLDPVLLEQQVERQRQGARRNAVAIFFGAWLWFATVSFVFASAARVPFPQRFGVAALGGLIGSVFTLFIVRVVQRWTQSGMLAVLEPGGRGRDTAVYSHAEALAVKGNREAATKAFDQVRAEHGEKASLLRAEADVQLRSDGDAERARELQMRLRKAADATRADELYATHRLIDLYLGPIGDEARAVSELRRLVERFPGTRDAEGAQAELDRRRALKNTTDSQSRRYS
jgi:hypothetical protein